jgi:glycosyltransferase involved in cell wall biosynthesis
MTFVIITHVFHKMEGHAIYAYAPYVREMNIWIKYADKIIIVAPQSHSPKTDIEIHYEHKNIDFVAIESFDILRFKSILFSIYKIPRISWNLFSAMQKADHIHLRCPGNIGLLGCLIQLAFPNKIKTAKYAGNWDPQSKQPWSYRLQKWILSNTFLTRNIQVLVYGEWEESSKNIKPFFTASYFESDTIPFHKKRFEEGIRFVFVGALVQGKNPLYALKIVEALHKKGVKVTLNFYGEGIERNTLENYSSHHNLEKIIALEGNQPREVVQKGYENSHFVILPSQSEGWPKAIAEGMFWGCVPLASSVSCVPFMLDWGNRGILLSLNLENDVRKIQALFKNENDFAHTSKKASDWSRLYTMDIFEVAIKKIMVP